MMIIVFKLLQASIGCFWDSHIFFGLTLVNPGSTCPFPQGSHQCQSMIRFIHSWLRPNAYYVKNTWITSIQPLIHFWFTPDLWKKGMDEHPLEVSKAPCGTLSRVLGHTPISCFFPRYLLLIYSTPQKWTLNQSCTSTHRSVHRDELYLRLTTTMVNPDISFFNQSAWKKQSMIGDLRLWPMKFILKFFLLTFKKDFSPTFFLSRSQEKTEHKSPTYVDSLLWVIWTSPRVLWLQSSSGLSLLLHFGILGFPFKFGSLLFV